MTRGPFDHGAVSSGTTRRGIAYIIALSSLPALAALTVTHQDGQPIGQLVAVLVVCYVVYAFGISGVFSSTRAAASRPMRALPSGEVATIDWLLAIRGLAAFLVFVMHSGIAFGHDVTWGGAPWAWIIFSPAWLGIVMFFALSGYLMGKGFYRGRYTPDRAEVTRFLRNRWFRIAPLCLVVAPLIVLLQAPEWIAHPDLIVSIWSFTFDGMHSPVGLGAFWSLSTEWQFYLAVPLIFIALRRALRTPGRTRLVLITLGCLAVGTGLRWVAWQAAGGTIIGWNPYVYTPIYCNLDIFVAGFLANWWLDELSPRARIFLARMWPALLIALALVYSQISYEAMGAYIAAVQPFFGIVLPGLTALAMVPILIGAEISSGLAVGASRRWLPSALYWVGALTFPVYLVHSPLMIFIQSELGWTPYLLRFGLAVALSLLIAFVLHMTVERAALAWRDRARPQRSLPSGQPPRTNLGSPRGLGLTPDQ